jgi:hypothetical protein
MHVNGILCIAAGKYRDSPVKVKFTKEQAAKAQRGAEV